MTKTSKFYEGCDSFTILCHRAPDVDTAGSAVALAAALEGMGKKVVIHADFPIRDQVKHFMSVMGRSFGEPDYDADCIVVVDTNSPSLVDLDSVRNSNGHKAIIDHHAPKDGITNAFDTIVIDESAISTTQIVYHLFKEWGITLTREMAIAIASGMVTDSAGFSIATTGFFHDLAAVLDGGGLEFEEILDSISVPKDWSEKIARLKGAQRLEFIREGDYIISVSRVSSFESSVAKSLLYLGADVSFVGAAKDGEVRISSRASRDAVNKGIHLGRDILPGVMPLIKGDAGGHAGAAGANGVDASHLDEALELCLQRTREFLKLL